MTFLKSFKRAAKTYEIVEADIGIGNQRVRIRPNYKDMQIAYKLWVELCTRKIGLEIDLDNDVIYEIYDSWYEFFKITRELIKDIPIAKVRNNESTKELVRIAIEVLNGGMRPHLTKWQARFRKWYETETKDENNKNKSPQDIQKKFPNHKTLTDEMIVVNKKLIEYGKLLKKLALDIGGDNTVSKSKYGDRKYLLIGILIGGLLGFIGSITSGYFFRVMEYPDDRWMLAFSLGVFIVVGLFCYKMIRELDKKSK